MIRHVTLLKGGTSTEREVSLVTGAACAAALREVGYDVNEVEVTGDVGALFQALSTPAPDARPLAKLSPASSPIRLWPKKWDSRPAREPKPTSTNGKYC